MMDRVQKLMLAIKAMTAMKLTRDDNVAAEIIPGVFLGSVGCAFNKDALIRHKITHILTCADKIHPRFPDVSLKSFGRILEFPFHLICYL